MTMTLRYTTMSAASVFRNTRFLIFTVGLPVVLYLVYSGIYGGETMDNASGYSINAYLMISMAAFGGIGAALNATARVAVERQTGWNRQLLLTALTPSGYLVAKIAVSMLVCLPAIVLVFLAGAVVGKVQLSALEWIGAGVGVWLGLIPFAVLGLVIGYLGTSDSIQPMVTVAFIGSSLLGGLWFPLEAMSSWVQDIAKLTPAYHLAVIARAITGFGEVGWMNIAVLVVWTLVLGALATWAYRRSGRKI